MKHFSRARLLMWAFIYTLVFVLASTFIPRLALMTILNGVFLGIVVAVIIVYTPLMWFAFRKGRIDRVSQMALGIGLIWLSIAGQRLYWLIWHSKGMPETWNANPYVSAMVFLSIIGGGLFVAAPGYPPEDSVEQSEFWGANRNMLLFFGTTGGFVTFIVSIVTGGII